MSRKDELTDRRSREELIAAYIRWVQTHDPSAEWSWEAVHDGVWWTTDPVTMLDIIIEIINRVGNDRGALLEIGAGPLEDVLGGDARANARAEAEARINALFRTALAGVHGVKHGDSAYDGFRRILQEYAMEKEPDAT